MSETQAPQCETIDPVSGAIGVTRSTSSRSQPTNNETRERCKLLYFQGVKLDMISAATGVKRGTLRTWANRYRWNATVAAGRQILIATGERSLTREATTQLAHTSGKLRASLASVLQKGADALDQVDVKPTTEAVRDLAEALEPLTRSAKIIHSWGSEGPAGIVLAELLGQEQPAIEVAACALDTTTGSVPALTEDNSMPQDPEHLDDQAQAQPPN